MKKDKFIRNTNGELSVYGLHCGYLQESNYINDTKVQMYHEGAVYSVRWFQYESDSFAHIARNWVNFEKVTEARKLYRLVEKQLAKGVFLSEDAALELANLQA
jgi:hypothetical protein